MTQEPEQPQPQQLPPPYAYYPPPPLNTYALLSLIISLVVFPPVGIWLGYQARKQIAQTGERGGELATAGIVIGWIFTSLFGLLFVVWCGLAVTMMTGVLMSG